MRHILMIDDVAINLKLAADVLKQNYRVSMAKSGKQALQLLEKVRPDLILLDVLMPDMDGYETYERIKSCPESSSIPVIFLTADKNRDKEIKGLRMGAMDYIRKPFEPEVMISRIEKVFEITDKQKNLEICSMQDPLTKLWNRKYLEDEICKFVVEDEAGVFFVLDMDNFKSINDNFGHVIGDAVLVNFAETLQENTTSNDILCRIGGDEFIVFLKGQYDQEKVISFSSKIIQVLEEKVNVITGGTFDISVSIGISRFPEDANDFTDLYHKADKALYYVKQNGKKGFHFYQDKVHYSYGGEKLLTLHDIKNLKKFVEEKRFLSGAYQVEYDGFRNIYQFVTRCIDRTKQKVQVVLFTLEGLDKVEQAEVVIAKVMKQLEESISASLRRGDVSTRFSQSQYVIILMDTDIENGQMVAKRVESNWNQMITMKELTLKIDIEEIYTKIDNDIL